MPYKNILWIKLEKRLLNDYRFYNLSEDAQLIYVKLLMLSAETTNRMPKDPKTLQNCLRSELPPEDIERCISEIKKNFPKFKTIGNYYYFKDWDYKHNLVYEDFRRNSEGTPKESVEKSREEKIYHNQVKILFTLYKEKYKEWISDAEPIFNWGACERLVKPHLKKLGLEKMQHLLLFYLKYADDKDREFWKKNAYSLQVFLSANTLNLLNTKYDRNK